MNVKFYPQAVNRIKMIKAMEFIARNVADEEVFDYWLRNGVSDGEITYGDLSLNADDFENLNWWLDTDNFEDLCTEFLTLMKYAREDGFSVGAGNDRYE